MIKCFLMSSLLINLVFLAKYDFVELRLPDLLLGSLMIFSCMLKGLGDVFLSIYDIFTLFGISFGLKVGYRFVTKKDGLGWGDVKFLSLCGLWVPMQSIPLFLICVGCSGFIFGLLWRKMGRGDRFPLGVVIVINLSGWIGNQL